MLSIRPIRESDYDNILVPWWEEWGWTPPLRDFLPQNGIGGLMVWDNETPICAGFIYTTNSAVSWIDWIISSRTYRYKPERTLALKLLIRTLTNISKSSGSKYAYALIKQPRLIKLYEDDGYIKGESYSTEMIKAL